MPAVKPSLAPPAQTSCPSRPNLGACDRRVLLTSFLASAAQATAFSPAAQSAALTPYQRGFNLEYGLQADGRIKRCDGGAQPNCVSTSSLTDLHLPPWAAEIRDPKTAMEEFDNALLSLSPDAELLESQVTPSGGVYHRYKISSSFEYDVVEVLIAPQQPPYDSEPPLVTFRSQAGTLKYIWPITQPVSDMGAQRKRMIELRKRLGWRIMGGGCDEIECFAE